jgi:hypothetical protein
MAAITFAARIVLDLRLLIPEQRVINASRGPDAGTSEVTTRTVAFGEIAAGAWIGKMGSPGAFDDTTATVGDQVARSWGARYAKHLFLQAFDPVEYINAEQTEARLMNELEELAMGERQYVATPFAYDDGED